jgi:ArsR family transcriptional regulator, arsenate/arsenite/antimonite-responsive transcriptional repressor
MQILTSKFDCTPYFDYSGKVGIFDHLLMPKAADAHARLADEAFAVDVLAALAHPARLRVFRLLVQRGPGGEPAGAIAQGLAMPASTLSFHLAHLAKAELVRAENRGRQVIYRAEFGQVQRLTNFLFENCCNGVQCVAAPGCGSITSGEC